MSWLCKVWLPKFEMPSTSERKIERSYIITWHFLKTVANTVHLWPWSSMFRFDLTPPLWCFSSLVKWNWVSFFLDVNVILYNTRKWLHVHVHVLWHSFVKSLSHTSSWSPKRWRVSCRCYFSHKDWIVGPWCSTDLHLQHDKQFSLRSIHII